ncbi:U3 small nucleolar RNA-associated protein 15 homolog [Anneissia japonica]|uniref:U3 small nucleolar RNA-associated protein 15 homolog n=1 Tax=Anneissia japonica TaxID=1529436 RepID=UPI0014257534|nr:U3 small nucleolar RNA-associated protein 15 homolog [Anneissia japonica]
MAEFKKTTNLRFPRGGKNVTKEQEYWKDFEFPVTVKDYAGITHINFSPLVPYQFVTSSSTRVQIYNPLTSKVDKTISRFKDVVYSGILRDDGKLLVAGGAEALVRIFDVSCRAILRTFKGHEKPIQVTKFLADNTHIMSCSDDQTVRCWDIPSETEVVKFDDHSDYVRCGCINPASKDVIVSGSYDHTVKLFDLRSKSSILSVDHGQPVESVLMFPGGGIFLSAGGNYVKVWDALAGGRLLATISDHHKTITCMCFSAKYDRLLTGSLDRHVKVHDVTTYKTVAGVTFSSPILSVGISADDQTLAVGMADGLLSIKHRKQVEKRKEKAKSKRTGPGSSYQYYVKGHMFQPKQNDLLVDHRRKEKLQKYDVYLRKFEHSKALDAALQVKVRTVTPNVTITIMQELIRRDVINSALSGRDEQWLRIMVTFIRKNISNTSFTSTLVDISNLLLDIYSPVVADSPAVTNALKSLKNTLKQELEFQENLHEVSGMLDSILAASQSRPCLLDINTDFLATPGAVNGVS